MSLRDIPRSAVGGAVKLTRLPLDIVVAMLPGNGNATKPAAAIAVDRFEAALREADTADERLAEARTLKETLALVLFGEAGRHGEVASEIRKRHGATAAGLIAELNRGSHGTVLDPATLKRLPESTRELIHALNR
jgi:hypothetical protein